MYTGTLYLLYIVHIAAMFVPPIHLVHIDLFSANYQRQDMTLHTVVQGVGGTHVQLTAACVSMKVGNTVLTTYNGVHTSWSTTTVDGIYTQLKQSAECLHVCL